ncbi:MAG: acyl carrier protein [Ruminococcus flavefaciens]|nr:acyl carrier protein [Ruminococcus flavefaciens]
MKVEMEKIIEIIREELCIDDDVEITGETCLRKDLELDSLDTISLISALEDEYDINDEMDYSNLVTVNDIKSAVEKLLAQKD